MSRKALVVEGNDDMHSVIHITRQHGVAWKTAAPYDIKVVDANGYPGVLETSPVAAKTYDRLGVVLDADSDPAARWASIRDRLAKVAVYLPSTPATGGTTVAGIGGNGKVGVWMMPDNGAKGYLENFLATLVPSASATLWQHAQASTKAAVASHGCNVRPLDVSKAEIYTWLAWQDTPGLPFGTALKARFFNVNAQAALDFVAWFNSVFA